MDLRAIAVLSGQGDIHVLTLWGFLTHRRRSTIWIWSLLKIKLIYQCSRLEIAKKVNFDILDWVLWVVLVVPHSQCFAGWKLGMVILLCSENTWFCGLGFVSCTTYIVSVSRVFWKYLMMGDSDNRGEDKAHHIFPGCNYTNTQIITSTTTTTTTTTSSSLGAITNPQMISSTTTTL